MSRPRHSGAIRPTEPKEARRPSRIRRIPSDKSPLLPMEEVVRRTLCAIVVFVVSLAPALADVRIEASPGGEALSFLEYFEWLRQTGQRVVIDGPCFSACTLVLSTIPHGRICVTRRAILGFHAARMVDQFGDEYPAPEATQVVAETYPAPIRDWIRRHGGLTRTPIFLGGRELAAMYRLCR
jgi:hypothetical protein